MTRQQPVSAFESWGSILFWIALASIYSMWTWTSELNDFGGDSALYLLTAQHWSPFGSHNPAAAAIVSTSIFPPLYPLLLALFAAGDAWLLAHQLTALCGIGALFLFWKCLRLSGLSLADSLVAAGLLAAIPGYYMQALHLQSEFLFLFFVALCLYAVHRLERSGGLALVAVAALAAAAAYLTRSVGLVLVMALLVYVFLGRPKREWPVVIGCAVLPVVSWMLSGQRSTAYVSYWSQELSAGGWSSLIDFAWAQSSAVMDGFARNLSGPVSMNRAGVYLIALCCGAAWLLRLKQRRLDALMLGAYFAVLLLWPYPAERVRYLLPAVPILLVQLFLAIHGLPLRHPRWNSTVLLRFAMAMVAITVLPNLLIAAQRWFEPMPAELAELRQSPEWHGPGSRDERIAAVTLHQARRVGFQHLRTLVPPQDCIYAIKPALVILYSQRTSLNAPRPDSSLGTALDADAAECRFVHMETFNSPSYPEHFYPLSRWHAGLETLQVNQAYDARGEISTVSVTARIR